MFASLLLLLPFPSIHPGDGKQNSPERIERARLAVAYTLYAKTTRIADSNFEASNFLGSTFNAASWSVPLPLSPTFTFISNSA